MRQAYHKLREQSLRLVGAYWLAFQVVIQGQGLDLPLNRPRENCVPPLLNLTRTGSKSRQDGCLGHRESDRGPGRTGHIASRQSIGRGRPGRDGN